MSQVRICTCLHMISMHSQPKKKNGQTRPCFFSDCECLDFTENDTSAAVWGQDAKPVRVIDVEPGVEFSPSSEPSKPDGMDFGSAMALVAKGKRVTKHEWGNPDIWIYLFMHGALNENMKADKYVTIHRADGSVAPLAVNEGDLIGQDWVEVI